jgi:glycosyltransferase involved in cell wall biosynthesis
VPGLGDDVVEPPEQLPDDSEEALRLNVVMLVRDRWRLSQQALASLAANTRSEWRLTVVDDASEEPVGEWLRSDTHICVIRNEVSRGTGWARNKGIKAAREAFGTDNLLALSDNDVWFAPGWDTALLHAYRNQPEFRIIGGGCHPYLQAHQPQHRYVCDGKWYVLFSRDAVSGYSWLLDWETYDKYGPFDQHALGVRQSEDYAVCRKVVADGFYVGSIVPEVVIHAGLTDTFGQKPPGWELIDRNRRPGVLYL